MLPSNLTHRGKKSLISRKSEKSTESLSGVHYVQKIVHTSLGWVLTSEVGQSCVTRHGLAAQFVWALDVAKVGHSVTIWCEISV